jgi:uncharacterized RDD family membrane protein YckC
MINCQNCDAPVLPSAERCEKCGAKLLNRRVVFGAPRREDFNLIPEEPFEYHRSADAEDWHFQSLPEISLVTETPAQAARDRRYGGFFRRATALLIDFFVIALLAAAMGLMAYIGYKVGLAAHQRTTVAPMMMPLILLLTAASTFLAMSYFVVFHGLAGKTIGKWVLRLRVVGIDDERIGYRRACLRWIAGVLLAPLLLGFLWVLWSREKRAWHDYLARTWVIVD